jgi:hypothetical protein
MLSCIEIATTQHYGRVVDSNKAKIAKTITELRQQQMDVLSAVKFGDINDDDVAAFHSLDQEIRYLADEMFREDSSH